VVVTFGVKLHERGVRWIIPKRQVADFFDVTLQEASTACWRAMQLDGPPGRIAARS